MAKATLLLFSQVRRMTPVPGLQPNDGPIAPFTQWYGAREPMLSSANLWSERAVAAQIDLAKRLKEDGKDTEFLARFGRVATSAARDAEDLGFQIHQAKLHDSLKDALRETGLAWRSENPEPYDTWQEYVELHPRVGEAVMATLGIACAMSEGLDIVGDQRAGSLHDCLIRKQPKDVYNAWLRPTEDVGEPRQASAHELFEFVVFVACDISKLDVETLAEMGANREPIRKLMQMLAERAKNMEAMDPGSERTAQFGDETASILKAWKTDRANMDNYWKKFFGVGLLEPSAKVFEKVIAKVAESSTTIGLASTGALAGLALQGPLLASGAGLGIGLFTHSVKTFADLRKTDRESPFRYLTLLQSAGVVIRADLQNPFRKRLGDPLAS